MRSLSILYLALDLDLGHATGEATHVLEVVRELAREGHRVILVLPSLKANRDIVSASAAQQVTVRLLRNTNGLLQVREILATLKRQSLDVVYERRFVPKVGAVVAKIRGIPLVVEVNALAPDDVELYHGHPIDPQIPTKLRSTWYTFWLKRAAAIITVTEGLAQALREEYGLATARIEVVPNAANIELFKPMDILDCRTALGIPPASFVTCFVGDLAPWYDLDCVFEALALLVHSGRNLRILIVGDGVLRHSLEEKARALGIEDRVRWTGRVPHELVPKFVGASDVALAPFAKMERKTRVGISALKIFEYFACARPVLTTPSAVMSLPELADVVVVVEPGDSQALAAALDGLLGDSARRGRLGSTGRKIVETKFTWASNTARLAKIMFSEVDACRNRGVLSE